MLNATSFISVESWFPILLQSSSKVCPMLSKTLMFVRVIVLFHPNIEYGRRGIFSKRENSLFWGLKWTTVKLYNLPNYFVCECSLGACNLTLYIHVVINWRLSKQYISWRYGLTVSPAQVSTYCVRVFFWCYPLTSCYFSNDRKVKINFLKMHMK